MGTRYVQKVKKKHASSDAMTAMKVRKRVMIGLGFFGFTCLIAFGFMIAGYNVPAWAFGRFQ